MSDFSNVTRTELAATAVENMTPEGVRIAAEMERRAGSRGRLQGFLLGALFAFLCLWGFS